MLWAIAISTAAGAPCPLASASSTPPVVRARTNPVTYVSEIGGAPKSPTPGTAVTLAAPASLPFFPAAKTR